MFNRIEKLGIVPLLIMVVFLVLSCSKDDEQPAITIYGNYVVTVIETEGQYDFVNTGTVSSNLMKQVEEAQGYNFSANQLTIIAGSPDLINMNLIEPSILTTLPENIPLIRYSNISKTMNVDLEIGNKEFTILTPNAISEGIGEIEEMEMLNQFQIKVKAPQRIYDFNTQAWVNTIVSYTFNRIYV